MTDNPLDADEHRRQRIRERAYHLWESEGRLGGHDQEYWERAEELIGMEDSAGAGQLPNPMNVPGNDPSLPPMVEEASIQENLGEFPDQTDQGEHLHTPSIAASHEHDDATSSTAARGVETSGTRGAGADIKTPGLASEKPKATSEKKTKGMGASKAAGGREAGKEGTKSKGGKGR